MVELVLTRLEISFIFNHWWPRFGLLCKRCRPLKSSWEHPFLLWCCYFYQGGQDSAVRSKWLWEIFSAISRGPGRKPASQSTKYYYRIKSRMTWEWAKAWQRWQPDRLHGRQHSVIAQQSWACSKYDFHYLASKNTSDLMNKNSLC